MSVIQFADIPRPHTICVHWTDEPPERDLLLVQRPWHCCGCGLPDFSRPRYAVEWHFKGEEKGRGWALPVCEECWEGAREADVVRYLEALDRSLGRYERGEDPPVGYIPDGKYSMKEWLAEPEKH